MIEGDEPEALEGAEFVFRPDAREMPGVALPTVAPGLYTSYAEWKRHRRSVLRLGAGTYLSDRTEKR